MRLQFLKDGRECLLADGAVPGPEAIVLVEFDMSHVRELVLKARHNTSGRARSGPVQVKILGDKTRFRVTYLPEPGRPADRQTETVDVEAFSDRGAKLKAQGLFLKQFRGDGYNVHRSELTAEVIR